MSLLIYSSTYDLNKFLRFLEIYEIKLSEKIKKIKFANLLKFLWINKLLIFFRIYPCLVDCPDVSEPMQLPSSINIYLEDGTSNGSETSGRSEKRIIDYISFIKVRLFYTKM